MDARVIVLRDTNGAAIKTLDISDLDNANNQAVMALTVETRCDLGEWHQTQVAQLAPWGNRISEPS